MTAPTLRMYCAQEKSRRSTARLFRWLADASPVFCFALVMSAFCTSARADEDFFGAIEVDQAPPPYNLHFFIEQKVKYGLQAPDSNYPFERDEAGLSRVETDIFFENQFELPQQWQFKISAKGEANWLQWQNGKSRWRLNHDRLFLKDAYLDRQFDNGLWLRLGHQVFAWGESQGLSVTDVLAPVDYREYGQSELRDIREQIPALMVSMPAMTGKLILVSTYDAGHNRYADAEDDFYPLIAIKDSGIRLHKTDPRDRKEWALRYERSFNGGDLALVAADTNNNDFTYRLRDGVLNMSQDRVSSLGVSANRVWNSFVFRGEAGYFANQPIYSASAQAREQNQVRLVGGFDYSGWTDWTLSYEINGIVVVDDSAPDTGTSSNWSDTGQVFLLSHQSMNARLRQQLWLTDLLQNNGYILRYDLHYEISDHWSWGLGLVLYDNNNSSSQLHPFRQHDTFNLSLKYSL